MSKNITFDMQCKTCNCYLGSIYLSKCSWYLIGDWFVQMINMSSFT